ncbi:unnamed protein product, partial [Urochloa humidicola]
ALDGGLPLGHRRRLGFLLPLPRLVLGNPTKGPKGLVVTENYPSSLRKLFFVASCSRECDSISKLCYHCRLVVTS